MFEAISHVCTKRGQCLYLLAKLSQRFCIIDNLRILTANVIAGHGAPPVCGKNQTAVNIQVFDNKMGALGSYLSFWDTAI